jgi:hypothetical protein
LPADKWVIRRYRSVGTQANDLAEWLARFCAWSATYSPNVRNKLSLAAEKIVLGERAFTKDDLQIIQPKRCIGAQSGTRKGSTGTADRGLHRWLFGGPRTVERTWTIDLGTLHRAGYVGNPARNWWKSRDQLCSRLLGQDLGETAALSYPYREAVEAGGLMTVRGSNTQARFRKPQGRWIASYTEIAWGVGLSHERSDVAGAVDSVEMIPGIRLREASTISHSMTQTTYPTSYPTGAPVTISRSCRESRRTIRERVCPRRARPHCAVLPVDQVKIAYFHRPRHLLLVNPREAGCAHG